MTNNPTTTSSMQTVVLKVGLHCEGCERRVTKAIWHIKGITSVDVDNNRERVTVTGFVDPSRILKAVKKTGKPVELWKYQNGNKNLFGSQPIATTVQPRVSNVSSVSNVVNVSKGGGNKASKKNSGNKKAHTDFQTNITLSDHDRLQHPLPDFHSEVDSDEDTFSGLDFYSNDVYADFKPPKNKKNDFANDFHKSPKNQKSGGFYDEFKPSKNQKNSDLYSGFKSPKNQKNSDLYSGFKSPKNQKSDFYEDFKPSKEQIQQKQKSNNNKNRTEYSSNKLDDYSSQFGLDDENDFSYQKQKQDFGGSGQRLKATTPYAAYGNHKDSSQVPEYEFQKSGNNFSEQGKSQYLPHGFESEEKDYNQKKQKSQVAPKYVSFEDDYQPKSESNRRAEDRGYEQKFFVSQGHEQSYHPSYSHTYHENNRVPVNGFTNMFSEENPNACSIM